MRKLKTSELKRISVDEYKLTEKIPVIIVLDNVRSAYNVGSVFRTADAFAAEAIYLCGITAAPPHKEIQKTALGAAESVPWKHFTDTNAALDELQKNNYTLISIEQTTVSQPLNLYFPEADKKFALIFGNEVSGIDQQIVNRSDVIIEIPQAGTKHSLNISVCAGIILWSFFKRHSLNQKEQFLNIKKN